MKFSKKRNRYEASNVWLEVTKKANGTLDVARASSYDWWIFVRVVAGKVVFNNYSYSMSTNRHQSKVRRLLQDLDIKIDYEIQTPKCLTNDQWALVGIKEHTYEITKLRELIQKKGTRRATNEARQARIASLIEQIKVLTELARLDNVPSTSLLNEELKQGAKAA